MNYKGYILLFVLFLLITSSQFTEVILSKINGTTVNNEVTYYGNIVKGIILILSLITINILIEKDMI